MTNLIKHKRVEFSELFYFGSHKLSKTTALIHHLHNGILTWNSLFDFFMSLLVLINSWMIQTVYTNRYGKNSLFNMVIMFINMGLLLFISNMIGYDWQLYFHSFGWAVGTLTLTLFFQYLVEYYRKSTDASNRKSIKGFLWMTGLRTFGVYLAALLPINLGIYVFILSILLTFIMPTHIAVIGSNTPSTAAMVLLICFSEIISVTLLMAVGTKPNKNKLMS